MSRHKPANPKVAALRRQGTLNRTPEAVQDEQFASDPFFDARDLVQVKYEMLRRVEKDDWAVSKAASTFGFSRPAFYAARGSLETVGLAGLVPRKRGPRGAHKLTDEVLAFVDQLREADPGVTLAAVVGAIARRFGRKVHRRSLQRALERRGK